ncbi:MAG: hypothetical protein KIS63_13005 [Caldilineales bacterium]|nr:hypothetical protein [Caldilineales bacterium]
MGETMIDAQLSADVAELRAAVFGNLMRQEPGMVKDIRAMQRTLDAVQADLTRNNQLLARQAEQLDRMATWVDRALLERELDRETPISRLFYSVALNLMVIIFCAPILISTVREQWLGSNILAPFAVLLAMLVASLAVATFTRKPPIEPPNP